MRSMENVPTLLTGETLFVGADGEKYSDERVRFFPPEYQEMLEESYNLEVLLFRGGNQRQGRTFANFDQFVNYVEEKKENLDNLYAYLTPNQEGDSAQVYMPLPEETKDAENFLAVVKNRK